MRSEKAMFAFTIASKLFAKQLVQNMSMTIFYWYVDIQNNNNAVGLVKHIPLQVALN